LQPDGNLDKFFDHARTAHRKRPFLFWLEHLGAWPISTAEPLSGIFDFNRAPYFQSFVEVRIERSARRVRLLLHEAGGPLRWRDLQLGGDVLLPGANLDDQVDFVIPMASR